MAQLVIDTEALERLRIERGWSQTKLAAELGVSVATISRLNRGMRPGNEVLAGLCKVSGKKFPFCDTVM